jgi:hypothetical protein
MIRTTLILTFAVAVATALSARGLHTDTDGSHTVQTRTVPSFDGVDLRGSTAWRPSTPPSTAPGT